jgi:hypothetical protein
LKYRGIDIVNRAKTRLGEDKYDVQLNNCEHFCTWAITGNSVSEQVNNFEDVIDVLLPASTIQMMLKTRKFKQDGFGVVDTAIQAAADTAIQAAIITVMPVSLPVIAVYKTISRMLK